MYIGTVAVAAYTYVNQTKQQANYAKKSKSSGKEQANDIPSWARGQKPRKGENGKAFAKRLMDEKYGEGNYSKGTSNEYNQLKKYGDRGGKS